MPPAQQQQPRREPAPPSQASPPVAQGVALILPSTRALLATLRATVRDAGAPKEELLELDAWAAWVTAVVGEAKAPVQVRPLADYAAARELLAEVSARVVRACAGVPVARREALLAQVAAGERLAVAYLDQYMLQRGRRR
ncbi:MAG: hypothetical protein U0324_29255 [Polyangiales bacterium]